EPMPVVPVCQELSSNPGCVQIFASVSSAGIMNEAGAPSATNVLVVTSCARPYEMSGYCGGNIGENCVATDRSGRKSPRYSPLALRLKSVCSGAPGTARFLPEANTTKNP